MALQATLGTKRKVLEDQDSLKEDTVYLLRRAMSHISISGQSAILKVIEELGLFEITTLQQYPCCFPTVGLDEYHILPRYLIL
jgi:hypothetical protein